MRPGKDLIGKSIISINDGRLLGYVKDIYLNDTLDWITGIFLGNEGLLKRKARLIDRDQVVVFGIDAVLVKKDDVVTDDQNHEAVATWLRLDKLRGRDIDTPGGTKVGSIGDIILGPEGNITGFVLAKVHVEGPIAREGQIPRAGLLDTGNLDGVMTIDLARIEALLQAKPTENKAS